ncbi:hypothetical protein PsalN5692_00565 [Piscirickettsia salmonis]|uniref:hypothetical protein n=1 Tax=Piscirickettsia salmonis TaxID=1238 RepID=UPI0012B726DB|nr:hypothetical protein [Piscirickettsia salmonis]QGP49143.1 hypothetical protein PsalN5692_00565 [Piscirickettsia salmonis]
MLNLADIYTDYLIAQNKHATATGLADLMPDELSHDQITRLLNKTPRCEPWSAKHGVSRPR